MVMALYADEFMFYITLVPLSEKLILRTCTIFFDRPGTKQTWVEPDIN